MGLDGMRETDRMVEWKGKVALDGEMDKNGMACEMIVGPSGMAGLKDLSLWAGRVVLALSQKVTGNDTV